MTDASSLQQPLAVEAVHWSPGGGAHLLVRVAGRWRRRPPATSPVLVVDTDRGRRRFPALAEPPSGGEAEPGLWVVCFVVPASLAPCLAGRLTLVFGNVAVALPAAVADPGEPGAAAGDAALIPAGPEPIVVTDMRGRREERDPPSVEPSAMLEWLDLELTRSRENTQRLRAELERAESGRDLAERQARSATDLRHALEREHADGLRAFEADARSVLRLVQTVKHQARALASEVEQLRRATGDALGPPAEAGHAARLEGALLRLAAERADGEDLLARAADRAGTARAAYVGDAIAAIGRQIASVREAVALLPPGAVAGAAASAQGVEPDRPPAPALAVAPTLEPDRPPAPALAVAPTLEPDRPPAPALAVAPTLEPDRLAAALSRLREQNPPADRRPAAGPSPPRSRWLRRALRRVLDVDPTLAGEAVIGLIPAMAGSGAARYDIVLGPGDIRAVTIAGDAVEIERRSEPRPLADVSFRVEGDLEGLARLLVYGAVRRRLSHRVARVRGADRGEITSLRQAVRHAVPLDELAAGAQLDAAAVLALVAAMIDPEWTVGEVFTIALEAGEPAYLHVSDGERPRASREGPSGRPTTTILAPEGGLRALLAGESGHESGRGSAVLGASRPLALVREWIARAQRDS